MKSHYSAMPIIYSSQGTDMHHPSGIISLVTGVSTDGLNPASLAPTPVDGLQELFATVVSRLESTTDETQTASPAETGIAIESHPDLAAEDMESPGMPSLPPDPVTDAPQLPPIKGVAHALHILEQLQTNKSLPLDKAISAVSQAATRPAQSMPAAIVPDTLAPPADTTAETVRNELPTGTMKAKEAIELKAMNSISRPVNLPAERLTLSANYPAEHNALDTTKTITKTTPPDISGFGSQFMVKIDQVSGMARMEIPGHVQQPAWQQALAERVVFAVQKQIPEAELKLHPADLGPVNIRIDAAQDKVNIQMAALHADTREALETAMPRLREMFSQQGMELVRADIQQQLTQHGARQHSADQPALSGSEAEATAEEPMDTPARPRQLQGIVDIYA